MEKDNIKDEINYIIKLKDNYFMHPCSDIKRSFRGYLLNMDCSHLMFKIFNTEELIIIPRNAIDEMSPATKLKNLC